MSKKKNPEAADAEAVEQAGVRDVQVLRAFAHPIRVRLYYELGLAGTATATHLSQKTSTTIALVSYHLRQLADHGFIEPATGHSADGRERWWRLSERRLGWYDSEFRNTPGGAEIASAVKHSMLREQFRQVERYLEEERTWNSEWVDAAFLSDGALDLTPEELDSLHHDLAEVVQRYRLKAAAESAADRERVVIMLHGFPRR
ncbi:helix-turn-helix domain-containing protein [Catellatospora citrea]|uniref:helix-turn-helix domain-containing protein n=1 Tax=Catellatospora citrea TaxID=53366 RepID=UPI00340AB839